MGLFDRRAPFRQQRDGSYSVHLDAGDRQLLAELVVQLRSLLMTDSPALVRLFPPAYGDDEERNQGYAVLAGAELMERKLAALDVVEATLDDDELTEEQLETWMRSFNDLRLVLGTILGVTEDDDPPTELNPDTAPMFAAYEHLGYLLERIVGALAV